MPRAAAMNFFRVTIYHAGAALARCARRRAARRVTGGMDVADFLKLIALRTEALVKAIREAMSQHSAAPAAVSPAAKAPSWWDNDAIRLGTVGSVAVVVIGIVWPGIEVAWTWIMDNWEVLPPGTIRCEDIPSYLARQPSQNKSVEPQE